MSFETFPEIADISLIVDQLTQNEVVITDYPCAARHLASRCPDQNQTPPNCHQCALAFEDQGSFAEQLRLLAHDRGLQVVSMQSHPAEFFHTRVLEVQLSGVDGNPLNFSIHNQGTPYPAGADTESYGGVFLRAWPKSRELEILNNRESESLTP